MRSVDSARPVIVTPPTAAARPILVEVPHAGTAVPDEIRPELALDGDQLRRDADLYLDRLYTYAPTLGATLITTEISRFVVDMNRAPDDVDRASVPEHPAPRADAPRGLIWRIATDGTPALRAPLPLASWRRRIENYYRPYHRAVDEQVAALVARFGYVIVLSGHSMPSVGRTSHVDRGRRRADVVPGDRRGESCDPRITRASIEHFSRAGFSVALNDPYQGGETTRRLGRPQAGVHAIQVELNRDLYMDERTFYVRDAGFDRLREQCLALVDRLASLQIGAS